MPHLKKLTLTFLLSLLSLSAYAIPYCTAAQVSIHELALSAGGMMQTRSLYAITNNSKTACKLAGTPAVWGLAAGKNVYLAKKPVTQGQSVVLQPLAQKNVIPFKQLVWFSFHGNAASDGPTFNTIKVMLPGIPKQIYTLHYSGYSTGVDSLSPIESGSNDNLTRYFTCPSLTDNTWPLSANAIVSCG